MGKIFTVVWKTTRDAMQPYLPIVLFYLFDSSHNVGKDGFVCTQNIYKSTKRKEIVWGGGGR